MMILTSFEMGIQGIKKAEIVSERLQPFIKIYSLTS